MKLLIFVILSCLCVHYTTLVKATESDDASKEDAKNLLELMNSAQENNDAHKEANIEFAEKYGESLVQFIHVPTEVGQCSVVAGTISINFDVDIIGKFLKAFGKSITRLAIAFNYAGDNTGKEVAKLVNTHCANTLEVFEARRCKDGVFDEMSTPFTAVETVSIEGEWYELGHDRLGLDALFPGMRVLILNNYRPGYIFDRKYPNLNEVNVLRQEADEIMPLIENNPQIKTLRVEGTSVDFIKNIKEKLPQLVSLAFNVPNDMPWSNEPEIKFDNIKFVKITDYPHNIRFDKLSFKNAERIELSVDENVKDEWIQLLGKSSDLKSFEISQGTLNDATILMLSTKFNKLIKAELSCDTSVSAEVIVKFIENNKHMKKIILKFEKGSATILKDLKSRLEEKWQFYSIDKHYSVLKGEKLESFDGLSNGSPTDVASAPNTSNLGGTDGSQSNDGNNAADPNTGNNPGNGTSNGDPNTDGASHAILSKTLIVLLSVIIAKSLTVL